MLMFGFGVGVEFEFFMCVFLLWVVFLCGWFFIVGLGYFL